MADDGDRINIALFGKVRKQRPKVACAVGCVALVGNVAQQTGFRRPFETDHGAFAAHVMKDLAGDQCVVNKLGVVAVNENGHMATT